MKRLLLFSFVLAVSATALMAEGEEAVQENPRIAEIRSLYEEAEFEKVVSAGGALLEEGNLSHQDSVALVTLLAKSAAQENDLALSEMYLLKLIKLDPNTDFNPRTIPARFADVCHKVLKETGYVPGHKEKLLTSAVIEFANGSFEDAEKMSNVGIGIAAMLTYELEESGAVHCPSRENINYLLKELDISQSELADQDQKLDIGKVISVRNYVMGTFYNMPDDKFRIDARVIETETTLSKKHFSVEGDADEIGDLTMELAGQLLAYMNVEADKIKQASAKVPDINLAALVKFSEAVAYEEMGDLDAAREAYAQAYGIAPNFVLALEAEQGVKMDLAAKL
jgi:tetratricopeptide (TPR) repeat protein